MGLSLGFGYGQKKQRVSEKGETKQFSDEVLNKLEEAFTGLLGKSSIKFLNYNELPVKASTGVQELSYQNIVGNNLLLNAKYVSSKRYMTLNTINDDLTLNEIITLTYATDDTNGGTSISYNDSTYNFVLGEWLFYRSNDTESYAVNLRTYENKDFRNYIYMGTDNIFSKKAVSSGTQDLYKFNQNTGNMEVVCTLFTDTTNYYRYTPLMYYNGYFLCDQDTNRYSSSIFKLFKIDFEQKTATLVSSIEFNSSRAGLDVIQTYPNYVLFKHGELSYSLTIDPTKETFSYQLINTLGYTPYYCRYNPKNQTFSSLETNNSELFLKLYKFNYNNLTSLEIFKEYKLQSIIDSLNNTYGKTDFTYYAYGAISDNFDKIRIIFYSPTTSNSYKNVLIGLEDNLTDWQAVNSDIYNYSSSALTGFISNTLTDNKLEVKTVLPEQININLTTNVDATITVEGGID